MATTIKVNPVQIRRSVRRGEQYAETVTLGNIGAERYSYRIQPAPGYGAWVDPDPEHCAINAQEERSIVLNLQPPERAKIGVHKFPVTVVNEDVADDETQVDLDLLVPIPPRVWALLAALVLILLAALIWWSLMAGPPEM